MDETLASTVVCRSFAPLRSTHKLLAYRMQPQESMRLLAATDASGRRCCVPCHKEYGPLLHVSLHTTTETMATPSILHGVCLANGEVVVGYVPRGLSCVCYPAKCFCTIRHSVSLTHEHKLTRQHFLGICTNLLIRKDKKEV